MGSLLNAFDSSMYVVAFVNYEIEKKRVRRISARSQSGATG